MYVLIVSTAQATYLEWLAHTEVNAGQVDACDDCSSEEIQLPVNVPFGNYYHNSIYVSTIVTSILVLCVYYTILYTILLLAVVLCVYYIL